MELEVSRDMMCYCCHIETQNVRFCICTFWKIKMSKLKGSEAARESTQADIRTTR